MQIMSHTTQQSKHIHCHLITYSLFNYTVRSSDDTAWDGRTNKWTTKHRGCGSKQLWPNRRSSPRICPKQTRQKYLSMHIKS